MRPPRSTHVCAIRRLIFLASFGICGASLSDDRPNIVIIFTDDWGYADLGVYRNRDDVRTPHLDALSQQGVLFTDAYVTAPQCAPSRAGLMTGRYQQRFGFDSIPDGPLPLAETTIASRLQAAGYVTGMVGKWHLEPNAVCLNWARKHQPDAITGNRVLVRPELSKPYWPQARGFDEFFVGERHRYWANYGIDGRDLQPEGEHVGDTRFRVDVQTDAGLAFIDRNADNRFFLYLAYFAPHVPLEATEEYLKRFPGRMPERRRTGLAMMSAVDEGVGRIVQRLRERGVADNTLVMFTSDNGAPLGAQTGKPMADVLPVNKPGPAWDGSRNDPLTGEKGMVAEGGIRIPMVWSWPARLPKNKSVTEPVISLDMTASTLAAAEIHDVEGLDGIDLIPWISGSSPPPQRDLFWKFWNQAAIRSGDWKYIRTGDQREMLFNIQNDVEERKNLISERSDLATALRAKLATWMNQLTPPGWPSKPLNIQEVRWYDYYFEER